MPELKRMIVAEISRNWCEGHPSDGPLISQQLEAVIEHNAQRGYRLHSWRISRLMHPGGRSINETIVAVFERDEDRELERRVRAALDAAKEER